MGAYNRLICLRLEACPKCGHSGDIAVQFKWGQRYLHEYSLGDTVRWSLGTLDEPVKGPMDTGDPLEERALLVGYEEACPECGHDSDHEYEVMIVGNRIASYRFAAWA